MAALCLLLSCYDGIPQKLLDVDKYQTNKTGLIPSSNTNIPCLNSDFKHFPHLGLKHSACHQGRPFPRCVQPPRAAPYLLRVLSLLHVVEFVVLDVAVARERRLPGDGDRGGGAGEGADVGSGAGQLDCNTTGSSVRAQPALPRAPGKQGGSLWDMERWDQISKFCLFPFV